MIILVKEANNFLSIHDSFLHKPDAKIQMLFFVHFMTLVLTWLNVKQIKFNHRATLKERRLFNLWPIECLIFSFCISRTIQLLLQ